MRKSVVYYAEWSSESDDGDELPRGRWSNALHPGRGSIAKNPKALMQKRTWSPAEDALLQDLVEMHGTTNW